MILPRNELTADTNQEHSPGSKPPVDKGFVQTATEIEEW